MPIFGEILSVYLDFDIFFKIKNLWQNISLSQFFSQNHQKINKSLVQSIQHLLGLQYGK